MVLDKENIQRVAEEKKRASLMSGVRGQDSTNWFETIRKTTENHNHTSVQNCAERATQLKGKQQSRGVVSRRLCSGQFRSIVVRSGRVRGR